MAFSSPIFSQQLAPAIEWSKSLGGTRDEEANASIQAFDGGFIIVGSTKSNDGDLTGHYGSVDSSDAWIVKLSADGNIEWQKNLGGTGADVFTTIIRTNDGNYICFGTTTSNNNGDVSGNRGGQDFWVVKINRQGNILWQKCYGGTGRERGGNLRQNADGSFFMIGATSSNDGNVSGNHGGDDIWVVKMQADGNLLWQHCYGTTSTDIGFDIHQLEDGRIIIAVSTILDNSEFGPGLQSPTGRVAVIDESFAILKQVFWDMTYQISLSPVGMNKFAATLDVLACTPLHVNDATRTLTITYSPGSSPSLSASNLITLSKCRPMAYSDYYRTTGTNTFLNFNGNDYISVLRYDTTFDNGATHSYGNSGMLVGYRANGALSWQKFIGGPGVEDLFSVNPISETQFLVAGNTNFNGGDITGHHGGKDFWVVKLGKVNLVKGSVFADYDIDGTKDANEPYINNLLVQSEKGSTLAGGLTQNGIFTNSVDTGSYTTKVISSLPYYTAVPATKTSTFTTYNNTDSFSFALQPIPGKRDYMINLVPVRLPRPGFKVDYIIQAVNVGTDTLSNKTVTLVKDARFSFNSSVPTPTSISGDTIRWNIPTLNPRDTANISIQFTAAAPPALRNGDTVYLSVMIDTAGDLAPANNFDFTREVVVGSYDPNDKSEAHGGVITPKEIADGKYLVYTIRFQNTGTDTAFNIIVRDTLDNNADWNSLQMISASHPYQFVIKDGKYCTWTFSNILLPDSNRNEPKSHGYISYRIRPKASLGIGDKVMNNASIYFDFNLPVVTNTTQTEVKPDPPAQPVFTGLLDTYCSLVGVTTAKITNLPALGSGTTVTVKIDGTTVGVGADSTFSFNVSSLAAGSHSVTVQFSNATANKISSDDFTITAAVNPDVNVSANITTITNLATNVIVTATNAAGGGAGPLYTFARDRNFTNITQTESASNTWTFNPSILSIGDNKIYVRMKSNATCVVTNTVVDSILLVRSSVTGITDPDMPGQVINIYPNPFKDAITINGLSTSKTYTVKLFDLHGKQLVSKRVSGRTSIVLTRQHHAAGIYWLSLYDEKRMQLLGTVKMMKE